jgi:hypothetical protein
LNLAGRWRSRATFLMFEVRVDIWGLGASTHRAKASRKILEKNWNTQFGSPRRISSNSSSNNWVAS